MDLSRYEGYPTYPKIWGREIWLINTPAYCAKLLVLTPGMRCSLHRHHIKDEMFFVLQGLATIEVDSYDRLLEEGDSQRIYPQTWHRFWTTHPDTVILEVSTFHSDTDVERLEPSGPLA